MSSLNQIKHRVDPDTDVKGNSSLLAWLDYPEFGWDYTEDFDESDGYDDNNTFFKKSISKIVKRDTRDAEDFLEDHLKDFAGKSWKPKNFFRRMYFRHILTRIKRFVEDLRGLDLSETARKKSLREKIIKANRIVQKAERQYEKDQISCLQSLAEAIVLGKEILDEFRYLETQGRLDD